MSGRGIATRYVDLCVPRHIFVPATLPWVPLDPNHEHGDGVALSLFGVPFHLYISMSRIESKQASVHTVSYTFSAQNPVISHLLGLLLFLSHGVALLLVLSASLIGAFLRV